MQLKYYSDRPNFGDALNPFIFNKLFKDLLVGNESMELYGIGSFIDSSLNNQTKKIIFGTGVREILTKYDTKNWDLRFVRGPLSAKILGDPKYIVDSAYLLKLLPQYNQENNDKEIKFETAIVPYFKQMDLFNWDLFEKISNIKVIDPRNSVEQVISDIKSSRKIIAVAMHGAIVADMLRVPWVRLKMGENPGESRLLTEFKWNDWLESLDLKDFVISSHFYPTKNKIANVVHFADLVHKVKRSPALWQLSQERLLDDVLSRLSEEVINLKKDYEKK